MVPTLPRKKLISAEEGQTAIRGDNHKYGIRLALRISITKKAAKIFDSLFCYFFSTVLQFQFVTITVLILHEFCSLIVIHKLLHDRIPRDRTVKFDGDVSHITYRT